MIGGGNINTNKYINLKTPVSQLYGIGAKRAEKLNKLGLYHAADIIYHIPRGYQHRGNVQNLENAEENSVGSFLLTIGSEPRTAVLKNRMTITKFTAFDDTKRCAITYFNQDYIKNVFKTGDTYRFWGKLTIRNNVYELSSPQYELYLEDRPLPEFNALYPLTEGISQKIMAATVRKTLEHLIESDEIIDLFDDGIRNKYDLCDIVTALRKIHSPDNFDDLNTARKRFAFDELFLFALGMTITKNRINTVESLPMQRELAGLDIFLNQFEFELTNAQKRAIDDIYNDICGNKPMSRLISGDVGSGKTVCAAAAAYIACKNQYQTAMMVPTEILAQQHYNDLKPLFENLGIRCMLLTGSVKTSEKRRIHDYIVTGIAHFIIGTHALLSAGVEFFNLGLVITDEQHRFGIMQRAALTERGRNPHVLVMSATPIPRTLALILYGDLDVSVIDEMPPGRQKVDTFVVDESYRARLNGFIRRQVDDGRQVYIVCPAVEAQEVTEEDDGDVIPFDYGYDAEKVLRMNSMPPMKSAIEFSKELQENIFPDLNIGFIHGKMKGAEKERIMTAFAANEINVLVSTTVIEVGVNVPNATLMIVENAERFGLSQLHQLRGRVGRGKHKSYCILVSDSTNEKSQERLTVMKETSNGYKIAEKDLELRGPGDFFPTQSGEARQHGGYKFKIASVVDDMTLMTSAVEAAHDIVKSDPNLELPEHQYMYAKVTEIFELNEQTFN